MNNEKKEYYKIIFVMCCLSASSIGLCMNSVGIFFTPVSMSLGVLRGSFALSATLSSLFVALISLGVPRLLRLYNYKKVLWIGVLLASISTLLMGLSQHVVMFYILGVLRGIGIGVYSMVPITIVITNWFVKKHGVATSIALSFSGLASTLMAPILSFCIVYVGWEITYIIKGIIVFLIALPALLLKWSPKPEMIGLKPYGDDNQEVKVSLQNTNTFCYVSLGFICLCIFTLLHTSITGMTQHFASLSVSIGLTAMIGATMTSCSMFGNIMTKLLIGFISDRFNALKACLIMIGINMISLMILMIGCLQLNITLLLLGSFLFGSIYSVGAVGIPLLTKSLFGSEHYTKAYSIIGFLTSLGSSLSLTLIGYLYDFSGTYLYALILALVFHVFNIVMICISAYSLYKKRKFVN